MQSSFVFMRCLGPGCMEHPGNLLEPTGNLLPTPSVHRRQVAGVTTADHSRVAAALESATSENTRRVYRSGWERWHRRGARRAVGR